MIQFTAADLVARACPGATPPQHGQVAQKLGIALLARRGVRLVAASGDGLTDNDDLGGKMMRQIARAFMEHEKARVVAKLRGARERKRKETGKKVAAGNHMLSCGPRWLSKRVAFGERKAKPAASPSFP